MEQQNPQMPKEAPKEQGGQQELYDIFVAQGIKLAGPASDQLRGKASVDTLASALFTIVKKVEESGIKNGIKFELGIMLKGAEEILIHLVEMTKTEVTEENVKAIAALGVAKYLEDAVKTGKMTTEQLSQLIQQSGGQVPESPQAPAKEGLLSAPPEVM